MTNKKITYFSIFSIALGGLLLVNGLVLAWTPPTQVPPAGNVAAPVNVSSNPQTKAGGLWSDDFFGAPLFYDKDNSSYFIDPTANSIFNRVYATADMRSPIYYDRDNTGYYLDPSAGSRMTDITFEGELKPDGANCLNGQIIQKTAAGDWDCVNYSASGGVTDHGALQGLADDDHPQYLLINGSRAMAGNLKMDGNWVSNDGGNEGLFVDASGNVGVNKTPTEAMDVNGNLRVRGVIRGDNNGNVIIRLGP